MTRKAEFLPFKVEKTASGIDFSGKVRSAFEMSRLQIGKTDRQLDREPLAVNREVWPRR